MPPLNSNIPWLQLAELGGVGEKGGVGHPMGGVIDILISAGRVQELN